MKKNLIIISAVVFLMLILFGVTAVLADGFGPVAVPAGNAASGQTAPALVAGPPASVQVLSTGEEFANSSHLSKPQSQPATELALPTNP